MPLLSVTAAAASDPVVAEVTIKDVEPFIVPEAALIVVVPTAAAVANPEVFTVAAGALDEDQVTVLVRFFVLPSLKVPVALNCCVCPTVTDGYAGVTWIETKLGPIVNVKFCVALGKTPFDAVNVMGNVPLAVGVPLRIPALNVTPPGSAPDSVMLGVGGPVAVTVNVKFWVALGETPFDAVKTMAHVPIWVGVPLRTPALNVTPVGSAPDSVMPGVGVPVAVTVNEPTVPLVKVALFALVMTIAGAVTVPENGTSSGLGLAVLATVSEPTMDPAMVGANWISIVQPLPAASGLLVEQVVPLAWIWKSPEGTTLLRVTALLLLLVILTAFAALVVPTACAVKVRLAGATVSGASEMPARLTSCGLLLPV